VITEGASLIPAAPVRPTAIVGGFASILGDVVLRSLVVLALVAVTALAVRAIIAAGSFILETL